MVTTSRRKKRTPAAAAAGNPPVSLTPPAPSGEESAEAPQAPEAPAAPVQETVTAETAPRPSVAETGGQPDASDTSNEPEQSALPSVREVAVSAADNPEQDASLEHGRHVAFLADRLFDELAGLHGLGKSWRRRLHLAALLHDIGFAEGRKQHHKTSMRMIDTDKSLNIADKDRPLVALLARYHRKAWPSQKHSRFAELSGKKRDAICKAAALLRIADGLDYRHLGNIQDLAVEVTEESVTLVLRSCGECTPERERAIRKGDLLEHLFSRKLECVCRKS